MRSRKRKWYIVVYDPDRGISCTGEGPFESKDVADDFGEAECGMQWWSVFAGGRSRAQRAIMARIVRGAARELLS